MEQVKSYYNTSIAYFNKPEVKEMVYGPYVAGVLGILVLVYISFMASRLPPHIAQWVNNPVFKIVFIIIMILINKINPIAAFSLAAIIIIGIPFTSWMHVPHDPIGKPIYQVPSVSEQTQMIQEVNAELVQNPAAPIKEKLIDGLHPKNRPTEETLYAEDKVLDPNDPSHPGWKVISDPKVDVAVYELNPPYAQKELPENMSGEKLNVSTINVPEGGPTRYSAYHGYKLA